jgi:hypothetical protein
VSDSVWLDENMDQKNVLMRSWMFVPGNRQRMIEKSLGGAVDAITQALYIMPGFLS